MPRDASGQVVARKTVHGTVVALRFRAYGSRRYVTLGYREQGWTHAKAELELQNVLADVRRGIWRPPEPVTPPPEPTAEPTFHAFASEWLSEIEPTLRPNTILDYRWQLTHHLLPFFKDHRLSQISVAEVDRYRAEKVREQRLSASSINKTLTRLGQILDVADERELIARNPMSVNRRRRKLRASVPQRTYIDQAAHIETLLAAAGQLDSEARNDRPTPRRAILCTLTLAGLRIGELTALRWSDVDLAGGHLRVEEAKTDAGIREVRILPVLHDELAALKAKTQPESDDLVFGTARGKPQSPSNIRRRVLDRSCERADELLEKQKASPLPGGLTPHSLRRTFASLLFALGYSAPEVMEQLGHTDARLTLRIYAKAMRQQTGERKRLRALVEGRPLRKTSKRSRARQTSRTPKRASSSRSG
jgi:integrase